MASAQHLQGNRPAVSPFNQQRQQFLDNIKKAQQAVLTPSQRVRINLCIIQASYLDGALKVPYITKAPKLGSDLHHTDYSSNTKLVRDCEIAVSWAASHLPPSFAANADELLESASNGSPQSKRTRVHGPWNESGLGADHPQYDSNGQFRLPQETPLPGGLENIGNHSLVPDNAPSMSQDRLAQHQGSQVAANIPRTPSYRMPIPGNAHHAASVGTDLNSWSNKQTTRLYTHATSADATSRTAYSPRSTLRDAQQPAVYSRLLLV